MKDKSRAHQITYGRYDQSNRLLCRWAGSPLQSYISTYIWRTSKIKWTHDSYHIFPKSHDREEVLLPSVCLGKYSWLYLGRNFVCYKGGALSRCIQFLKIYASMIQKTGFINHRKREKEKNMIKRLRALIPTFLRDLLGVRPKSLKHSLSLPYNIHEPWQIEITSRRPVITCTKVPVPIKAPYSSIIVTFGQLLTHSSYFFNNGQNPGILSWKLPFRRA